MHEWPRSTLLALGLVLLTLAAYAPALGAGFIWDDDDYVTENPLLRDGDGLRRIWLTTDTPQYYPLVFTSFWIEHRLWGLAPAGYHAVNVLLHALNALLVAHVLRRLDVRGAWWIAALFAVHPVHVESVAWITERKNVLSALFYLLAFASWLRFERDGRRRSYALTIAAFVAALLAKTVAASLPVALALATLWRRGRLDKRDVLRLAPLLVVGAAMALVTVNLERGMVSVVGGEFDFAAWQRPLVAAGALLFYPWKIVWPFGLCFNYPRWNLAADVLPLGLAAAAVAATAFGLAFVWRRGHRGPTLAAAFYAVTIFPALGFLDVYPFRYSFVADHFQYLASLGPLMLLVGGAFHLLDRSSWKHATRAATAIGLSIVIGLAALTASQAAAYEDEKALWEHTLERNPRSWLALNNLGLARLDSGDAQGALELLDRAVEAQPRSAESHTARGLARARLGDAARALDDLDRAVELDPTYPLARLNRGDVLLAAGRPQEAIDDLSRFLQANPDYVPALLSRARALVTAGRPEESLPDFARALELEPDGPQALEARSFALMRLGRPNEALADLDRAVALDAHQARTFLLRGAVHDALGDAASACTDWKRACELGNCRLAEQRCGD
jgi:tetratricopeptide (TPR) repeat protein